MGPMPKCTRASWSGAKSSRRKSKTTPEDCARIILRAIEAPKPKPRYGVTPLATTLQMGEAPPAGQRH